RQMPAGPVLAAAAISPFRLSERRFHGRIFALRYRAHRSYRWPPVMTSDTTVLSGIDEGARRRFELAWRQGRPEPIERFLPDREQSAYLPTLVELVFIEMEFAWKARGPAEAETSTTVIQPPAVEAYLARFPILNESVLVLRLVRQEFQV